MGIEDFAQARGVIVLDLETTGLEPASGGIVEFGFCLVFSGHDDLSGAPSGWSAQSDGAASQLVDPGMPIPPEAMAVHHIKDADVRGAMSRAAFSAHLSRMLAACAPGSIVLAAHNAAFEASWLTLEETQGLPFICTWKCALKLWPDAPGHANQVLRYWRRPKGWDSDWPAHRAAGDAAVTAALLADMLNAGHSIAELLQISAAPALLAHCRVGPWRGRRWAEVDDPGFLDWVLARDFDADTLHTAAHQRARLRAAEGAA